MEKFRLSEESIRRISSIKQDPKWMLKFRLSAYDSYKNIENPKWGPPLDELDHNSIQYYFPTETSKNNWKDIPPEIIEQFNQIGVPEREKKFLAGVSTQYDSEIIYSRLKEKYRKLGIIFESIEDGLKLHPELFKKYFGKLIKSSDNKYSALNSAMWSGGSFVYVPKGMKVEIPVETYFRINADALGQFERTLIIADKDSSIHYIEGCSAPQYLTTGLHAGVVEIFAMENSSVKYTTLQNWSKNVYNLVTKRALASTGASVEWLDCNIGSKVTMKYPSVILKGDNSKGTLTSLTLSDSGQNIDSGGKMIHIGRNTKSIIRSKTISSRGGIATYRGISKIESSATNSQAYVDCDSLLLDKDSVSKAIPVDTVNNSSSHIEHEAFISSISRQQLEYLISKGFDETEAKDLIVKGFANSITEMLPPEYSVELERILYHFTLNK